MYVVDKVKNYGVVSVIVSIFAMFLWIIPIIGYTVSLGGIYLGFKSVDNEENSAAVTGIILSALALVFSVVRSGLVFFYG